MNLILNIINKIKINNSKKIRDERNMAIYSLLNNVNTTNELLNVYEFLEEMILEVHYYGDHNINKNNSKALFFDDMIFVNSKLIEIGKEKLLEDNLIQEKIDNIMYYLFYNKEVE